MSIFEFAIIVVVVCYVVAVVIIVILNTRRKASSKQKLITCDICGETFSLDDLIKVNHRYACPKCKCVINKEKLGGENTT